MPTRYYVPSEYSTIQEAVDAAVVGSSIIVSAGTYTGDVDMSAANTEICLRNVSGERPVIEGVVILSAWSILKGFTIVGNDGGTSLGLVQMVANSRVIDCILQATAATAGIVGGFLSGTVVLRTIIKGVVSLEYMNARPLEVNSVGACVVEDWNEDNSTLVLATGSVIPGICGITLVRGHADTGGTPFYHYADAPLYGCISDGTTADHLTDSTVHAYNVYYGIVGSAPDINADPLLSDEYYPADTSPARAVAGNTQAYALLKVDLHRFPYDEVNASAGARQWFPSRSMISRSYTNVNPVDGLTVNGTDYTSWGEERTFTTVLDVAEYVSDMLLDNPSIRDDILCIFDPAPGVFRLLSITGTSFTYSLTGTAAALLNGEVYA